MQEHLTEPVQDVLAKLGTGATAGAAAWSWVSTANDLLQLAVTLLAVLTGYATWRYMTVKRKMMEKQLDKEVERKE